MELSELLNEVQWRKCKGPENATTEELVAAFTHFCANYWHIRHPERGRIKFEMRDASVMEEPAAMAAKKRALSSGRIERFVPM